MSDSPAITARLARFLSTIAPGIFLIGYVIGTGSVTTMASAGAKYGLSLVWTLVLAVGFTFIMFVAVARATMLSRQTLLSAIRGVGGSGAMRAMTSGLAMLMLAGMVCTQIASIVGVMGIVTDVVRERTGQVFGAEFPPLATAILATVFLYGLFYIGRHELFLKVLAFLVALMGLSFLVTMLVVLPKASEFARGLIPSVPAEGNPQLLIAGMVGTTMAAVCLITRSYLVYEKGWTPADRAIEARDSLVSVSLMLLINVAIMASAAGTMYLAGLEVNQAIDMVRTLEPIAGSFAVNAFVVGIVAAGLSSLFPNYVLLPWLIIDYFGLERDIRRPAFRGIVLFTALFGLFIPLFGGRPVPIMIASQALSPVVMPVMVVLTWLVLRKHDRGPERINGPLMQAGMAVTVVFSLFMLYTAAQGFLAAYFPG